MTNDRWNPFSDALTLRQAMDRLLEDSFVRPAGTGTAGAASGGQAGAAGFPVDVADTDEAFEVRATLPGVRPEDVQITVHNDTLLIRGHSRHEDEHRAGDGRRWLVREHRSQSFQRAIGLPLPVDPDRAEARFEHGVLLLTLPKSEAARPRQIHIRGQAAAQGPQGQIGSTPLRTERDDHQGDGASSEQQAREAAAPRRTSRSST